MVERIVLSSPAESESARAPARGRAVLWTVTGMVAVVLILAATAGWSPQRAVEPRAAERATRSVPPLLEPTSENLQPGAAQTDAEAPAAMLISTPEVADPAPQPKESQKTPLPRPARAAAGASPGSRSQSDAKLSAETSRVNGSATQIPAELPVQQVQQARTNVNPATTSSDEQWLAGALERCSEEKLLAGVICEQKARLRYCEGKWGQVPQCTAKPRVD